MSACMLCADIRPWKNERGSIGKVKGRYDEGKVIYMWSQSYDVTMRTAVGIRYGVITVTVDGNDVEGMMCILKKTNPFSGTMDEKGGCRVEGKLTTLTRTIPYTATGRITRSGLALKLNGGIESFDVSGTAITSFQEEDETR